MASNINYGKQDAGCMNINTASDAMLHMTVKKEDYTFSNEGISWITHFVPLTSLALVILGFSNSQREPVVLEPDAGIDPDSSAANIRRKRRKLPTQVQSGELICMICQAPATGYNFDVVSCESCKAFFRRNAFKKDAKVVDCYTVSAFLRACYIQLNLC